MKSLMLPLLLATACTTTIADHPFEPADVPTTSTGRLQDGAATWSHEAVVSARWEVPLKGVVNLDHPAAADLHNGPVPIVLPVHVLQHPEHGTFIIDTGIPRGLAEGDTSRIGNIGVKQFVKTMQPEQPLASILEGLDGPLTGVFLTHMHLDHLLGLPDVPPGTDIYVGPGEMDSKNLNNTLVRSTAMAALEGHGTLEVWPFEQARSQAGLAALDVFGDGSLWALHTPGHTPGSTSFLVHTEEGPKLFTGDCSHTFWGWEHGVEPGSYTEDHAENAESLQHLKTLQALFPDIEVFVGHELPGEGTGVAAMEADGGR